MFLLKGSAQRGTPAPPAACAHRGARPPGRQSLAARPSASRMAQQVQAAFAFAMKELLLSWLDARGCYLDAFLCKEAPGLFKGLVRPGEDYCSAVDALCLQWGEDAQGEGKRCFSSTAYRLQDFQALGVSGNQYFSSLANE